MRDCLKAAQEGEWESIVENTPGLLARLERYRSDAKKSAATSHQRQQLEELQQTVHELIAACSTRQEQIAPLVKSLKEMPTVTDEP